MRQSYHHDIFLYVTFCKKYKIVINSTGALRCVVGEGMPMYRNPFEKGNLYVKFEITFPPNKFTVESKLKVGRPLIV